MKQFIINFFILFFISVIVWLTVDYSYQKKFRKLEAEKNNCQTQLIKKKRSTLTLTDASFIINKDQKLSSIKKGQLYYSVKTEKISTDEWKLTVELKGERESAADAADFKLNLPDNLAVSDLVTGSAFPIYPRKVIEDNYLLITGLAAINNNQMVFGEPNKIFAEFTIQATDNQINKKQITVNKEDTKIYFRGESVLDVGKSVSIIDLQ